MSLLDRLGVTASIVQAPMAGVSTPELAAAVSNAGGLGSLGVGATDAAGARTMIEGVRALTSRAFNVNVFTHATPTSYQIRESAWLKALEPLFREFGAAPPSALNTIYKSFVDDEVLSAMLVAEAVPVVSFHFGLPPAERIAALKAVGCVLLATATSLPEALAAKAAGMDAVVAQGWEAGGHRGVFDPALDDDRLGTMALTRLLVVRSGCPSSRPEASWTVEASARRSTLEP
jgi:nitronate monooxygenase